MLSAVISRLVILLFGTLYPAYASYKAVRTKNVKEYVKWMMYWIVFALFTSIETFTDVFCSWFPFYYEIKVILVVYLLSPATRGSSLLYRKFIHPILSRREDEIDQYIAKAKEQGYHTMLNLGTKGVNYATTILMQTAIKNPILLPAIPSSELTPTANRSALTINGLEDDVTDARYDVFKRDLKRKELENVMRQYEDVGTSSHEEPQEKRQYIMDDIDEMGLSKTKSKQMLVDDDNSDEDINDRKYLIDDDSDEDFKVVMKPSSRGSQTSGNEGQRKTRSRKCQIKQSQSFPDDDPAESMYISDDDPVFMPPPSKSVDGPAKKKRGASPTAPKLRSKSSQRKSKKK